MTKTSRLMLAVLALCGTSAALAQSSVTIYGRLNTTVEHTKNGKDSVTGLNDNASRLGFRGVEDLGNGLKVGFVLEGGFDADTGLGRSANSGFSFNRESELNLSGSFGKLRMGRFTPESYLATADYISMHNHDTGLSADYLYIEPVSYGGLGTSNKIAYRTPDMSGFSAELAVALHEKVKGQAGRHHGYDLSATYDLGAFGLGAGYTQVGSQKQLALRGSYSVGPFVLGAYYQRNKHYADGTRNNFRVSGMYTLNASEFHVNVGRANSWSNVSDSAATQWTLGYNYNLSKRTKVYTYYTRTNHGKNINYYGGVDGEDFSSFALGVRHNF